MKIFAICCVAAAVAMSSLPASAGIKVPASQCRAWFDRADKNNDGSIGVNEKSANYFRLITLSSSDSRSGGEQIMRREFFLAECAVGSFGSPR